MPNVNGQAYALTILTPILPGHEAALQRYLDALPTASQSPLAKTEATHFARWVIIPQLIYEGPPQKRDALQSQYLLFESNFDGADLDAYLEDLCRAIPKELDAIWGHCVGYPGTEVDTFKAYIRHNQIDASFFVAAYPQATVQQVRASLALRQKLVDFAVDHQGLDARALQEAFTAAFLEGNSGA